MSKNTKRHRIPQGVGENMNCMRCSVGGGNLSSSRQVAAKTRRASAGYCIMTGSLSLMNGFGKQLAALAVSDCSLAIIAVTPTQSRLDFCFINPPLMNISPSTLPHHVYTRKPLIPVAVFPPMSDVKMCVDWGFVCGGKNDLSICLYNVVFCPVIQTE